MKTENLIQTFTKLGKILRKEENYISSVSEYPEILEAINKSSILNPWFIAKNVEFALQSIGSSLTIDNIRKWIEPYEEKMAENNRPKTIGVVMAGNIPIVGFHDFICVILSGNKFLGKLSSDDSKLIPAVAEQLVRIEPGLSEFIEFTEGKLEGFDAVIATGSNNTSRYFEYYFGKYPHIIRKNRNGVAVLSGNESKQELEGLGQDIFMYFGLGCRNVSKLFVPKNYNFNLFFKAVEKFSFVGEHHKYRNNYDYYRSIYLVNSIEHLDNGFLMVKKDAGYSSPPSVIFFEEYDNFNEVEDRLKADEEQIQCVVSNATFSMGVVGFGSAQKPELWDYADGIDTMAFLLDLSKT
ncbi:MAG: acyl-CoA reductase [Bacteroidales bacterium]